MQVVFAPGGEDGDGMLVLPSLDGVVGSRYGYWCL